MMYWRQYKLTGYFEGNVADLKAITCIGEAISGIVVTLYH